MAKISIGTKSEKDVWEKFLLKNPESSFLQSWYWGEFNEELGKKIIRFTYSDQEKIVGACLAIIENAKRGKHLVVPGGPLLDWRNKDLVELFFKEIKKFASQENCVFVRLRPQLTQNETSVAIFREYGAQDAPVHLHAELTSQLNLSPTEDELLANMRKSTRYEIKKAGKLRISVTTSTDPARLQKFYEIQLETAKRQNFVPFSYEFLRKQFTVFAHNSLALLFESYLDNKLLSQAFVIFYNREAVYHYGTSTDEGRKYPGAYLSQWEIIKEAKKRGMNRYNFWGVSPLDNETHRFYKISVFKRGFGGQDYAYLHAQDLVIDKKRYLLNYLVEKLRKKMRKI